MKSVIWMSNDMLEQIVDCNGEYVLTRMGTNQVTQLGQSVMEVKDEQNWQERYRHAIILKAFPFSDSQSMSSRATLKAHYEFSLLQTATGIAGILLQYKKPYHGANN